LNIESKLLNTKGPRIKHVCRTAESVLRQTPATFGIVLEKTEDVDECQSNITFLPKFVKYNLKPFLFLINTIYLLVVPFRF